MRGGGLCPLTGKQIPVFQCFDYSVGSFPPDMRRAFFPQKGKKISPAGLIFTDKKLLCLNRSAYGAHTGTRTALDASVSIDHIFSVTSRDGGYGTFLLASTTADTFISNFISHKMNTSFRISLTLYHKNQKMQGESRKFTFCSE